MALSYPIVFGHTFDLLPASMQKAGISGGSRLCLVSDSTVARLYLDKALKSLQEYFPKTETFVFEAGEKSKTLETVQSLYLFLNRHQFQRSDILVALGGGVTGDLTGFTAATYLRGIGFIQVPTTLLAQVDSSVGGKTGVDFAGYKNIVGAFYQPRLVYMNTASLQTLSEEQFSAGMGEVIKTALIRDADLFSWIEEHQQELQRRAGDALEHVVRECCRIKSEVVEEDPYDKGIRAILNFGHTIGHAVEKEKNFSLLHGQCVSIGMAAAVRLSVRRSLLRPDEEGRILRLLQRFSLPVRVSGITEESIGKACLSDKKREFEQLKFVLLKGIGEACIEPAMTFTELGEGIRTIIDE